MSPLPARVSLSAAIAAGTVATSAVPAIAVDGATALDARGLARHAPVVPVRGTPVAVRAVPAAPASMTYQVQPGDSVWAIAQRTGTPVRTIVEANGLGADALIRVGQMLTIPSPAATTPVASSPVVTAAAPRTHDIVRGDTLSGIAARYGTTVTALMAANGLRTTTIYAGARLTIPAAAPAATTPAAPAAPTPAPKPATPAPATTHTVVRGDTLSGIAARHGTTVATLMSANALTSTVIFPGQVLRVSAAPATPTVTPQLVPNTFLHYTYPASTVAAANANKAALLAAGVPSREEMRTMVRGTATSMGVEPALAMAIAMKESGFNHASVSPANAIGTMQVIPSSGVWASDLVGRKLNLLDPQDNVTAGVAIIRQLVRSSSSLDIAIASYYQGAASVRRNGMYSDTRSYVAGVKAYMTQFGG
jgi:LysM repeat protein